ncbi:hypothetical protein ACHHYP_05900 [Achlya hypogyna]|uniref:B30.2/SPRY domain-containing protein n=1 Tax=Achlya hypogyna TaxID=1202772 RepID=A0A1V9YWH9_ACHHY|nr:hypothetical protein ACHHYP_05900 [Achlya hypogyna]
MPSSLVFEAQTDLAAAAPHLKPSPSLWSSPSQSKEVVFSSSRHWQTCRGVSHAAEFSIAFKAVGCRHIVLGMAGSSCQQLSDVFGIDFDVRTGAVLWSSERDVLYESDAAYAYEWGTCDEHVVTVRLDKDAAEMHFFMNEKPMGLVLRNVPEHCEYPAIAIRGSLSPNATTLLRFL